MSCCLRTQSDIVDFPASAHTPVVLCIDDDPSVSEVIQDRLDGYDVSFLRAFFGAQGIWMAVSNKPDVIITDLRMPQGDGTTVIECLKNNRRTSDIPIVVLTARNEPGLPRHLEKIGAASYLTKPIHFKELFHELERYIKIRRNPVDGERIH